MAEVSRCGDFVISEILYDGSGAHVAEVVAGYRLATGSTAEAYIYTSDTSRARVAIAVNESPSSDCFGEGQIEQNWLTMAAAAIRAFGQHGDADPTVRCAGIVSC